MMRIFLPLLLVSAASAQISFGPSVEISDVINLPVHVQAVDMDADGDPDILAAEDAAARALWWENDGDGHFSNRREWLGDIQASVISLADHDGDSIPDIWLVKSTGVPEGTHESMVARGQPGGTFAAPVPILTTAGEGAAPEVVADVNGDGRLDLVATGGVALRQADGSFAPLPVIAPADVNALAAVAEFEAGRWDGGDFAGSSAPEIVFRDGNEPFSVFLTTILADGSVGPRTAVHSFPEDEEIGWLRALPPEGPGMRNRLMVAVRQPATETPVTRLVRVDFPAEGPPAVTNLLSLPQLGGFGEDIYGSLWDEAGQRVLLTWGAGATEPDSRVSWISPGAESPVLSPVLSFTGYAPYPLLADLDGDETEDLLMPLSLRQGYNGRHVDHLVWHPGLGAGAFEASPNEVNQPNFSTYLSHAGDLDGDGDGDMVTTGGYPIGPSASNYSNQLIVWRNDGGSFTREVVAEDRDWIQVISTGDFNGDTRADLLVQTFEFDLPGLGEPYGTQRIYRLIQQPGGSFLWTLVSQEQLPRRDLIVADVDWDRDGLRDLLVQRNSGAEYFNTMVWLPGTATGYGPERFILSQWSIYTPWVVDMDLDGDPDLFGHGDLFGDGVSYWMENDGTGEISAIRRLPLAVVPGPDLDGDGAPEFVAESGYYALRPGVTFEWIAPLESHHGGQLQSAYYLDLDQDGDSDRVQGKATLGHSGIVALGWLENRNGQFEDGYVRPDGDPYNFRDRPIDGPRYADRRQAASTDEDGDGFPDLVVVSYFGRMEWFKITAATAPAAFHDWMAAADLTGHSAGPGSDWDSDGIANWDEFAFGSDPAANDPSHPGRPRLVQDGAGMNFTFHRRLDAGAAGLSYPLERSINLTAWDDWTPPLTSVPAAAGYEKVTAPVSAGETREFFRLAVPDPP